MERERFELEMIVPGRGPKTDLGFLSVERAAEVCRFHRSYDAYRETPLVPLEHLAWRLGVEAIHVKDESFRFGLNAFKALGASYAAGRYLAQRLGVEPGEMTFSWAVSPETRTAVGNITFVTATDGNHGRGVAWTARQLGQKSMVYMPKGSAL